MPKVVGVDEAGKGPVIGSMFIGFSIIDAETEQDFENFIERIKKVGVKDSKKLSPAERARIYRDLKELMDLNYAQLTPHLIDDNNSKGSTLNQLQKTAIVQVLEKVKPDVIYMDALTANPDKFAEEIKSQLSFTPEKVVSENEADANYSMVSAASIVAKELREKELTEIKANLAKDVGSGYPSDAKTQEFLKNNWNNEQVNFVFRKSWKTFKKYSQDSSNKGLDEYSN